MASSNEHAGLPPSPVALASGSKEYYHGEGPVRRSTVSPNELVVASNGQTTLYEKAKRGFEKHKHRPCLGTRPKRRDGTWGPYVWTSYAEVETLWRNFGAGLRNLGLNPGDKFGLYSKNRVEWIVADLGCLAHSIVTVPLYDTLGPDVVEYVINHAEIKAVIVSEDALGKLMDAAKHCPTLKTVILMENVTNEQRALAQQLGVQLVSYEMVLKDGSIRPREPSPPQPNSLWTIMYTSGTTAAPKGVMLLHRNIVAAVSGMELHSRVEQTDVHLSYLPLAHVYERMVFANGLGEGAATGFYHGEVTELVDDIVTLRPTVLCGVPRVFNRVYEAFTKTIAASNPAKRALFSYAYGAKLAAIRKGAPPPFWADKLVFSKTAQRLGGRVRMIVTGSAPMSPEVQDFLRVVFCCDVVQGYGLTETCAGLTASDPKDPRSGHVGPPLACNEVKLVDVPEMSYYSNHIPPQGEVCVRGANVFAGYYKDPTTTAEVLTPEGWFHTGDVGQWNADGTLSIIDRKKNIFKLAQGEYVASEKLEMTFAKGKFVGQIFVYGDSFKNFLVAVVVPNEEPLRKELAGVAGVPAGATLAELCKLDAARQAVIKDLAHVGHAAKLRGFELIKAVHLEPALFSIENGCLTPTMKLKRPFLKTKYKEDIDRLYTEAIAAGVGKDKEAGEAKAKL